MLWLLRSQQTWVLLLDGQEQEKDPRRGVEDPVRGMEDPLKEVLEDPLQGVSSPTPLGRTGAGGVSSLTLPAGTGLRDGPVWTQPTEEIRGRSVSFWIPSVEAGNRSTSAWTPAEET